MDDTTMVYDPAASYKALPKRYPHLDVVLGGATSPIRTKSDLILLSREGLPRKTLDTIASKMDISLERLSDLLHVSYRTLLRKKSTDHLSVHVSEQALIIAEVVARGIDVLEGEDAFAVWVHAQLPGLDGERPLDYLDTSFGASMMLNLLGRIEQGVY